MSCFESQVSFQSQVSSIMEALAGAAVAEICSLMEENCALIRREMFQCLKENQDLKKKISLMERTLKNPHTPAACTGGSSLLKRPFSTDCNSPDEPGDLPNQANLVKEEPTDPEEEPKVLKVKEEKLQTSCSDSSAVGSSAKGNLCHVEKVCITNVPVFVSVGQEEESGKSRRNHEEDTVSESPTGDHTRTNNDIVSVYQGAGSDASSETTGRPFDVPPNFTDFLPSQQSFSKAEFKRNFLIIEPGAADEGLDGLEAGLQKSPDQLFRTGHQHRNGDSPASEDSSSGFANSFSGTSEQHPLWPCVQQVFPDQSKSTPPTPPETWSGSISGKSFGLVGRHQRVPAEEKVYRCGRCGRQFPQLCRLKRHERVHTGEKPFRCTKCGKYFAHANNLKVHQSVHTGERRFSCAQCGKSFSFLSNLIRHKAVHTPKTKKL